jgi:hypothetical protein
VRDRFKTESNLLRKRLAMGKKTLCPFTRKTCMECALYRGRHHYLGCGSPLRDLAHESRKESGPGIPSRSADLRRLRDPLKREGRTKAGSKEEPTVRLKITDFEMGESRICELGEAGTWDWDRSQMLRLIDGCQVCSLDHLMEIAYRKSRKGCQEVEICEVPRFMLFSGG